MRNNSYIKAVVFLAICAAFVMFVMFYANALPKQGSDNFSDWIRSFKTHSRHLPSDSTVKSFTVEPDGVLYIEADGANIDIETWDKNEVCVIVEKSGDEERMRNYKVSFSATPKRVEVYAKNEKNIWDWGNFSVNIIVKTPKKYHPEIFTSGGDISIFNMEGNISSRTSGGNIKIENTKGSVKSNTSGGDIKIYQVIGNVDIETSGGNLRLKGIEGYVSGITSGGNIEMELIGENKGIMLKTSGGNVKLQIPVNTRANLDCSTSGGEVKLKVPDGFSGTKEEDEIKGSLNGGGNDIILKTSGGDIKIYSKE